MPVTSSPFDADGIAALLDAAGLAGWAGSVLPIAMSRVTPDAHGDAPRWLDALACLRDHGLSLPARKDALLRLSPWRKGPVSVGGIDIDAEWRSDLKWSRVRDAIEPLAGRNVLDVGCGNGYYALQMRKDGARHVIGIDPSILYVMQFLAINIFERDDKVCVLPLRLHEVPSAAVFDTVFSMGVLYHQRSPIDHLAELRAMLRPGGQLVLETLFIPGDEPCASTPPGRYARMKNVWLLPTISELTTWLRRTRFRNVTVADTAVTTAQEQRSTEWMTFESLADALAPDDPSCTVEGWPAPRRVVMTANAPG